MRGRHGQAQDPLTQFRPTVSSSPVAWAAIAGAIGEAFHLVSTGDEKGATDRLRAIDQLAVVRSQ
jgi:hypothetical protein